MLTPRRVALGLLAFGPLFIHAKEPANLAPHKAELRAYIDSGEYARDMAVVATDAKAWLEQRARKGGGKLAIVFDIDDTLLSDIPLMLDMNFGGNLSTASKWFEEARCPANAPVREVYQLARQLKIEVIYITGRPDKFREATVRNLQSVGCGDFAEFIFKPIEWKGSTEAFKTGERRRLTAAGYKIIANVGDQASDLEGGFSEKTFKLPNPFYITK